MLTKLINLDLLYYEYMLPAFLQFLEEQELISIGDIPNDDDTGFENRFKAQKYVYLANYFGLDLGYNHGMYRYGPYSSSLTKDYYDLSQNMDAFNNPEPLPASFDSEGFLNLVNEQDNNWLEIASTLLDQKPRFTQDVDLINHVESIKCDYPTDYIESVLNNLREHNLAL